MKKQINNVSDPALQLTTSLDPTKLSTAKLDPTKLSTAKLVPTKLSTAKLDPTKLSTAKLDPQVDPQLNIVFENVRLHKKSKTGKNLIYDISVKDNIITTSSYQENSEKRNPIEKIIKGKNIGKKNETSDNQQAIKEALAIVENKKSREGYIEIDKECLSNFPIMLCSTLDKLDFPDMFYMQPKLDGIRCIALYDHKRINSSVDGTFVNGTNINPWRLYSRHLNEFLFFDQIVCEFDKLSTPSVVDGTVYDARSTPSVVDGTNNITNLKFDGELMIPNIEFHHKLTEIINVNNKVKPSKADDVIYHIFDICNTMLSQSHRIAILNNLKETNHIKIVKTVNANFGNMNDIHKEFVKQGYEGSIIRTKDCMYINGRSKHCLKKKDFDTTEYIIKRVLSGTGRDTDCAIFECCTPCKKILVNNMTDYISKSFTCRPRGNIEYRKNLFINKPIGKLLTVQHQGFTEDGIPRFPVGISIRDYE